MDIRRLTPDDAPFILRLLNTPSWLQFIGDRNVHTVEQARDYLQKGYIKSYDTCGFGFYMLELTETRRPLGICGLIKRDFLNDPDIGFALVPEYEGKGYGFEAASAVLQHAQHDLGLQRLVAITDAKNIASQKLLEKLGFSFEKMVTYPGEEVPLTMYALLLR